MNWSSVPLCAFALASSLAYAGGRAGCQAGSGPGTAALVELYTSEGCSSCPAADKELGRLHELLGPHAKAVPLALHVGYWDYIGWKDQYAKPGFAERQSRLVRANGQTTVYTPQFFVAGGESSARPRDLREGVMRVNAQPAGASIELEASAPSRAALVVSAHASASAGEDPLALYVALAESGLQSRVTRGENRGATLAHDHVVREWIGPVALNAGKASVRREIALPAAWNRERLELAAFVDNERTGAVVQAVGAEHCVAP